MSDESNMAESGKAHHSEKLKSQFDHRLSRIEGQIKAVRRMIGDDVYCDEVLNQVTSVMSALNGIRLLLLKKHINSCVKEQLSAGQTEVVDELMKTIGRMTKQ
ncbi:MAG: metal-sensing transcriptional repressor [Spirochaetes bacterium]|jgi:DNA-binding FrmR family transcriptional regulator|nr:metal-sensing transcriptional repressor [Spirochaetota bacterium]